ncbi:hypothetical protein C357_17930 [Citreicella sp. 357]|nr:hypothetical protein C357_17930 [Citreicella sp. 357]
MDFIFWPPLLDNRSIAQQFFLGQCACGNDWDTKFDDLNLKKLFKWFDAAVVDPVRLFATPFHIVDAVLIESSREAGFVFDRARIVGAFEKLLDQSRIANYDEEVRNLTLEVLME